MPVVAKDKIITNKKNELIIEKDGIEELIKISYEKYQKAILPAIIKSIKEKIIQAFEKNIENKKNKLKNNFKKNVKKILDEIKEDDEFEKSISKLSIIIKETLNIFFGIGINYEEENIKKLDNIENQNEENVVQKEEELEINEKSKKEMNLFLDDLCKFYIVRLNNIISNLLKKNSNELSLLLFNEQEKLKKDKNIERKLSNEKTINDYKNESELNLKTFNNKKSLFFSYKKYL